MAYAVREPYRFVHRVYENVVFRRVVHLEQ